MHRIPVAAISIGILSGTPALAVQAQSRTPASVPASAAFPTAPTGATFSSTPVGAVSSSASVGAYSSSTIDIALPAAEGGRVQGFVRDAAGLAVSGASVLAVGTTVIAARSNARGRFEMALPFGDYILRATREGYVSTYREPVRVQSSVSLERVITLVRQDEAMAAANPPASHAHTDLAWQLRHLPRSVLRDGAAQTEWTESDAAAVPGRPTASLFGRTVDSSLRLASRLAATDFFGQLNLVTTTSADPGSFTAGALPRSVAYVVLGAPVGAVGDWRIRGAIGSGTESSWNVLGEYEAHRTEAHAIRFGLSYSVHGPRVPGIGQWSRSTLEARSVAGAFARDRWRPLSDLEVEYALRADRYDFLSDPFLLSASAALRARVLPATFVTIGAGRSMLAPGAEEFLPPPSEGPWLPPERTFTALVARDGMRAETVRHVEMGLAREFGPTGRKRALHVRAFAQSTTDQLATLFSTEADAAPGHYRVARAGSVALSGWAVGAGGAVFGVLNGTVEYSRMNADWSGLGRTRGLRRFAASTVRDRREWLDDVTATVEARMNDARTRVSVSYRANTAFSDSANDTPGFGNRFDVQLHQALPYHPLPNSRLELLFAVRTLFRDPQAGSSRYDELLTVAPPLRFMGGIQIRF